MMTMRWTAALGGGALWTLATVWNASLEPRGNSGITGSARVESFAADSALAELTVNGAKPGSALAWGLHGGPCATLGSLRGEEANYPAIPVDSTGTGTSRATIRPGLEEPGAYAIVVHRGDRTGAVASCGELKRAGN